MLGVNVVHKCNHMNKRLLLIVTGLGLIGMMVAAAAFFQKKQTSLPVPSNRSPEQVQPPPAVYNFPDIPKGAIFTYTGLKTAPSSLQQYTITQTALPSALTSLGGAISDKIGYTATPSSTLIKDSFVFLREEGDNSFSLTKTKNTVAFTHQALRTSLPAIQNASSEEAARSYLTSLNYIPAFYSLSYFGADTNSLEGVGVLDKPSPILTKHLFGISLNNTPILTTEFSLSWALVVSDDQLRPRMITGVVPFQTATPSDVVHVVSPADAVDNLNKGRGVLLGVSNPTGDYFGELPSFTRATIEDFSLVYAPVDNVLVPAYVFSGVGLTEENKQQSFEALVLAASSTK